MNMEIFKGEYVTAESATDYIDSLEIYQNGLLLREEAEKLLDISKKIIEAKSYCSKENFYIEGIPIEERLEEDGKNCIQTAKYIEEYVSLLTSLTKQALKEKQEILNERALFLNNQKKLGEQEI